MDNNILASPPNQVAPIHYQDEEEDDENLIKVKLFFYSDSKQTREKLFPEEWYTVVS